MHKFINNQIPSKFSDLMKIPDHKYPTNFSQSSFYLKGILRIVQNIPFLSVDLNYGMMSLIKKRKISYIFNLILSILNLNLILSFKRKSNQS